MLPEVHTFGLREVENIELQFLSCVELTSRMSTSASVPQEGTENAINNNLPEPQNQCSRKSRSPSRVPKFNRFNSTLSGSPSPNPSSQRRYSFIKPNASRSREHSFSKIPISTSKSRSRSPSVQRPESGVSVSRIPLLGNSRTQTRVLSKTSQISTGKSYQTLSKIPRARVGPPSQTILALEKTQKQDTTKPPAKIKREVSFDVTLDVNPTMSKAEFIKSVESLALELKSRSEYEMRKKEMQDETAKQMQDKAEKEKQDKEKKEDHKRIPAISNSIESQLSSLQSQISSVSLLPGIFGNTTAVTRIFLVGTLLAVFIGLARNS